MVKELRIAISCPDDRGLLAAVTAQLFDLGGNLRDATFAVLGEAAELTVVCSVPARVTVETLEKALQGLPALAKADITVQPFAHGPTRSKTGTVTHLVRVQGQNQPGLVARLAESFGEFGANVVRMNAEHIETKRGNDYRVEFELWVDAPQEKRLLHTASNIAESLGLTFDAQSVNRT